MRELLIVLTMVVVSGASACRKAPVAPAPTHAASEPSAAGPALAAESDPWSEAHRAPPDEDDERYEDEDEVEDEDHDDAYVPPPDMYVPPAGPHEIGYSTGAPECDLYLVVFDRIVNNCARQLGSALPAMTQSRDAQVAAFKTWDRLDPAARQAALETAAPGCHYAVQAIAQSAQSMGCSIEPAPRPRHMVVFATGSPDCDQYLVTIDKAFTQCADKLGPALGAMMQARDAQVDVFLSLKQLDEGSRKTTIAAAASGCRAATDAVVQSANSMGCPLAHPAHPPAKPAKPRRKP